jgi:glycerol-3-phosphate acyltransferase PlsY
MDTLLALPHVVFALVCGAVPVGLVLGVIAADVDIRKAGSGNIGATNAWRLLGWRVGLPTLVLDILKGVLPVVLARLALGDVPALGAVGLAAVVGHCWTPALRFRGGKGVATSAGVLLALAPLPTLLLVALWTGTVLGLRRSSLGALVAVAGAPLVFWWLAPGRLWVVAGIAVIVVLRHVPNIRRLVRGTEPGV